jgi:hypothetical protein
MLTNWTPVLLLDSPCWLECLVDSLIYATARHHDAELWTQDAHFEGLAGVRYFPKP